MGNDVKIHFVLSRPLYFRNANRVGYSIGISQFQQHNPISAIIPLIMKDIFRTCFRYKAVVDILVFVLVNEFQTYSLLI